MFGILNNKIQLSGGDVAVPVSNLTVGYSVTTGQNLYVNGPYSSLSGSLTVGRDIIVVGSISNPGVISTANYTSITGNTVIGSALNVLGTVTGTALNVSGPFASITGNIFAGSALNVVGTVTGTALQISGPFASVTGNIVAGSALTVVGTITGTALQITGPFASVSGNVVVGSSLIAATVSSQLLTVATTADVYGVVSARSGTGGLQVVNSANPSLQIVSSSGTLGELGIVTSASSFSSSSVNGDLVLRSGGGRLLLNTGIGSAAVVVSGTMVGINTTPSVGLDVLGNSRVVGSLSATYQISSAPSSTGFSSFVALTDTGSSTVLFQNGSAKTSDGGTLSATLRNNAGGDIRVVNSNSVGVLVQGTSGYVGINKIPSFQLDVSGMARISNVFFGSNSTSFYIANQNQSGTYSTAFALYQGTAGDTVLNSASGQSLEFKIGNTEYMRMTSGGLLGIGTTVPSYNLDVSGSMRCTSTLLASNSNLGDCGFGSSYACFSHSSRFTTGGYSFLSDNGGGTYINCSSGNQINFRCNNSQTATLNSSGVFACNTLSSSAISLPGASAFTGYTSQLNNDAPFYGYNANPTFTGLTVTGSGQNGYFFSSNVGNSYGLFTCQQRGMNMWDVSTYGNNTYRQMTVYPPLYVNNNSYFTSAGQSAGCGHGANGLVQIVGNGSQDCLDFQSNNTNSQAVMAFFTPSGTAGTIVTSGTSTKYNTSSDYRLKEKVRSMVGSLDRVLRLKPKHFVFRARPEEVEDGFMAHELSEVVPSCVTGEKDAIDSSGKAVYQMIDLAKLVPLLTAAVQELASEVALVKKFVNFK